jgi:DNA-binding NarL/FixJ family response regulator
MAPAQENATYRDRARGDGVQVLLAEDDAALRMPFVPLLRHTNGVTMVVEGKDGASAGAHAVHTYPRVAVFDSHMPRLTDIDAALPLRKQQLALHLNSAARG